MEQLDISGAIEAAANSGDGRITRLGMNPPSTSSKRRENETREMLKRFLEALPEDLTVLDLREALGDVP